MASDGEDDTIGPGSIVTYDTNVPIGMRVAAGFGLTGQVIFGARCMPGWLASARLANFGLEVLTALTGPPRFEGGVIAFDLILRLRVFRFESRADDEMISQIVFDCVRSNSEPARPYIEKRIWPAEGPAALVLAGISRTDYERAASDLLPGLRLLMNPPELAGYMRTGPKRDFESKAEWEPALVAACAQVEGEGHTASKERVAERLQCSTMTVERNCKRYFKMTWKEWARRRQKTQQVFLSNR